MKEIDLHCGERVLITRKFAKQFGFVIGKVSSELDVIANIVFVKLNHGPVIPGPTIPTDEGLCAPLITWHVMTIGTSMEPAVPHVTLYCDENMSAPECRYVAMSRVRSLRPCDPLQ